jgi:hypothetical protein
MNQSKEATQESDITTVFLLNGKDESVEGLCEDHLTLAMPDNNSNAENLDNI